MKRKEVQKFDLLEELRKAAGKGKKFVNEAIAKAEGEDAYISNTNVKVSELKKLERKLKKAETAQSLEEISKQLKEETIPLEMVITDDFWAKFQKNIYKLIENEKER